MAVDAKWFCLGVLNCVDKAEWLGLDIDKKKSTKIKNSGAVGALGPWALGPMGLLRKDIILL